MPTNRIEEERIAIPLDPEVALRVLLQVDPESEPAESKPLRGREAKPARGDEAHENPDDPKRPAAS